MGKNDAAVKPEEQPGLEGRLDAALRAFDFRGDFGHGAFGLAPLLFCHVGVAVRVGRDAEGVHPADAPEE